MGFAEQLQEILARLPGSHQTVLFSATLPKLLVEFARAGEKHGVDGLGWAGLGWDWLQGLAILFWWQLSVGGTSPSPAAVLVMGPEKQSWVGVGPSGYAQAGS